MAQCKCTDLAKEGLSSNTMDYCMEHKPPSYAESLRREAVKAEINRIFDRMHVLDEFDDGFIAGLGKALKIISEVYNE